jgi:hypothetical protein
MKINITKETITYDIVFGDYEDKTKERYDDYEADLFKVLSKMNLKELCPDKNKDESGMGIGVCPVFYQNPKTFDVSKEPCAECLVLDP